MLEHSAAPQAAVDWIPSASFQDDSALRARRRLSGSSHCGLKGVSCRIDGNRLILRGKVASYYLKQLAQELVRAADGGKVVVNELEVAARPGSR